MKKLLILALLNLLLSGYAYSREVAVEPSPFTPEPVESKSRYEEPTKPDEPFKPGESKPPIEKPSQPQSPEQPKTPVEQPGEPTTEPSEPPPGMPVAEPSEPTLSPEGTDSVGYDRFDEQRIGGLIDDSINTEYRKESIQDLLKEKYVARFFIENPVDFTEFVKYNDPADIKQVIGSFSDSDLKSLDRAINTENYRQKLSGSFVGFFDRMFTALTFGLGPRTPLTSSISNLLGTVTRFIPKGDATALYENSIKENKSMQANWLAARRPEVVEEGLKNVAAESPDTLIDALQNVRYLDDPKIKDQLVKQAQETDAGRANLEKVIEQGDFDQLVQLLQSPDLDPALKTKIQEKIKDNPNLLIQAVTTSSGDPLAIVSLILEYGGKENINKSSFGQTPLIAAVKFSIGDENTAMIDLLLKNGADINGDATGSTPLSIAAQKNNQALVEFLLSQKGIDVNKGATSPLDWAMTNLNVDIARLLITKGDANVNEKNISGKTPMQMLKGREKVSDSDYKKIDTIAKLLVDKGATIDSPYARNTRVNNILQPLYDAQERVKAQEAEKAAKEEAQKAKEEPKPEEPKEPEHETPKELSKEAQKLALELQSTDALEHGMAAFKSNPKTLAEALNDKDALSAQLKAAVGSESPDSQEYLNNLFKLAETSPALKATLKEVVTENPSLFSDMMRRSDVTSSTLQGFIDNGQPITEDTLNEAVKTGNLTSIAVVADNLRYKDLPAVPDLAQREMVGMLRSYNKYYDTSSLVIDPVAKLTSQEDPQAIAIIKAQLDAIEAYGKTLAEGARDLDTIKITKSIALGLAFDQNNIPFINMLLDAGAQPDADLNFKLNFLPETDPRKALIDYRRQNKPEQLEQPKQPQAKSVEVKELSQEAKDLLKKIEESKNSTVASLLAMKKSPKAMAELFRDKDFTKQQLDAAARSKNKSAFVNNLIDITSGDDAAAKTLGMVLQENPNLVLQIADDTTVDKLNTFLSANDIVTKEMINTAVKAKAALAVGVLARNYRYADIPEKPAIDSTKAKALIDKGWYQSPLLDEIKNLPKETDTSAALADIKAELEGMRAAATIDKKYIEPKDRLLKQAFILARQNGDIQMMNLIMDSGGYDPANDFSRQDFEYYNPDKALINFIRKNKK